MRGAVPVAIRDDGDMGAWAAALVGAAAAPSFVVRADGSIVTANAAAQALLGSGQLPAGLRAAAIDVRLKGQVQTVKCATVDGRVFMLALLPLPGAQVMGVGRDETLETNLIAGLSASRDLFRDLALCMNDFAFETDGEGVFRWVSPKGFLGYSAGELNGVRACDVFAGPSPNPFAAALEVAEVWLNDKSGSEHCLAISARSVTDGAGHVCGVRGIARDLTALKTMERDAMHARKREQLIAAVVDAFRAQVEPRRMMLAAADALSGATDSDAAAITVAGRDAAVRNGAVTGLAHAIEFAVTYQNERNGTVRLSRDASKGPYGENEQALIAAVAPQLGIAIALVKAIDAASPVRVDAASGLLNRHAFLTEAERLHARAARRGQALSAIAVHVAGGNAAAAVAGRVFEQTFGADSAAGRLEPHVFAAALIAEDAGVPAFGLQSALAAAFAEAGIEACAVDVGCATAAAEAGERFEDLLGRAVCALAEARREGASQVVSACASHEVTSC